MLDPRGMIAQFPAIETSSYITHISYPSTSTLNSHIPDKQVLTLTKS